MSENRNNDVPFELARVWPRCPVHRTWMQVELQPFPHWQCEVIAVTGKGFGGLRCQRGRVMKLRMSWERQALWRAKWQARQQEVEREDQGA